MSDLTRRLQRLELEAHREDPQARRVEVVVVEQGAQEPAPAAGVQRIVLEVVPARWTQAGEAR